jgi:uncharacterized membrane-anchored protein
MSQKRRVGLSLLVGLMLSTAAWAEDTAPGAVPMASAWETAMKAAISGPKDTPLIDQATLHLPGDLLFVPKAESVALMVSWGNSSDDRLTGMVVPKDENATWVITVKHVAEGYVKDDEAKSWNAEELLQSIREGTEAQNVERKKMGIPEMEIAGWVQSPTYDAATHRLLWSIKATDRGAAADAVPTINYNTYALGRDGYFEVNLLTDAKHIDADKFQVASVLKALDYNSGKKYSDYIAGTDRVAEYGLMALIGGIAAKKLGLLAMAGLFLAKFAKVAVVGGAVAGGSVLKFFKRRPKSET